MYLGQWCDGFVCVIELSCLSIFSMEASSFSIKVLEFLLLLKSGIFLPPLCIWRQVWRLDKEDWLPWRNFTKALYLAPSISHDIYLRIIRVSVYVCQCTCVSVDSFSYNMIGDFLHWKLFHLAGHILFENFVGFFSLCFFFFQLTYPE